MVRGTAAAPVGVVLGHEITGEIAATRTGEKVAAIGFGEAKKSRDCSLWFAIERPLIFGNRSWPCQIEVPEVFMRLLSTYRLLPSFIVLLVIVCVAGPNRSAQSQSFPGTGNKTQACPDDDSGLSLPQGFCATVFADNIGHARHMVVAPSGALYVNTWSGRYYGNDAPHAGGFLVALQDKTGKGKAEVSERFGETVQSGGAGGTGIGIYENRIYAEINDRIVRYSVSPGSIVPAGPPETIVSGLPLGGDHPMHPFIIDAKGSMYVDVAAATNSCQVKNRTLKSPGVDPCTELETRGGIWLYDANKTNQIFSPAQRFATGIRNAEGFVIDSTGRVFVTQHGRDQLHANWPDRFQPDQEATLPAEELLLLKQGATMVGQSVTITSLYKSSSWHQSTVGTAGKRSVFARA